MTDDKKAGEEAITVCSSISQNNLRLLYNNEWLRSKEKDKRIAFLEGELEYRTKELSNSAAEKSRRIAELEQAVADEMVGRRVIDIINNKLTAKLKTTEEALARSGDRQLKANCETIADLEKRLELYEGGIYSFDKLQEWNRELQIKLKTTEEALAEASKTIDGLTGELDELVRLHGMGSEREAKAAAYREVAIQQACEGSKCCSCAVVYSRSEEKKVDAEAQRILKAKERP